jgi:hypothetical protein
MSCRRSLLAALIVTALPAGGALAAPAPAISTLALPIVDDVALDGTVAGGETGNGFALATETGTVTVAFAQPPPVRRVRVYESVRYRPRRRYHEPPPPPASSRSKTDGFSQLHAGFLDPDGEERGPGFVAGFRGGIASDHVVFGGMIDWRHKAETQSELVSETDGPGGEPIEVRREFSNSSSDLVPIMGFLQVNAGRLPFSPYFGAAAGYEVLWLRAQDHVTATEFDATYGGFGWQAWAGLSLPLGGTTRLVGEIFSNQSEVSRDVEDVTTGEVLQETVNVDGAGMRFGLSWGF